MKVCATVPAMARIVHHHERPDRMSDISHFDRYRAARASLLIGIDAQPAPRDLRVIHGPRQHANQDGPVCASWYVDGLASGGHTVPGTARRV